MLKPNYFENGYKRLGFYLNIPGIQLFSKLDSMSDPVIKYHGYYFNYYDIENGLYSMYKETSPEHSEKGFETFAKAEIKLYLSDVIFGGYCFRSIPALVETY